MLRPHFENQEPAPGASGMGKWLCYDQLCGLGQVTSPASASASSLVKKEGVMPPSQGHYKESTSQMEHMVGP